MKALPVLWNSTSLGAGKDIVGGLHDELCCILRIPSYEAEVQLELKVRIIQLIFFLLLCEPGKL